MTLPTGTRVGAHRWPWWGAHPDSWGPPLAGTVVELDDPRAWAGTLAFPSADPDPAAVRAHVARCRLQGWMADKTAVAWDFGRVYFETTAGVRPYAQDRAEWESELAAERARSAGFRLVGGAR